MGASNTGDKPPLPAESTILTQTTTSQETPIVVENPPSWNRFLTIFFLFLGVFFIIFAFHAPPELEGPPSFFLAMMCLAVSLFFETSNPQMEKPQDVVLTVEKPVILDEPESKKAYRLVANICILTSFFTIMGGFVNGTAGNCFCGLALLFVALILALVDLQQSKAYKLKSGKSTIPEDISMVITTLLLLLIVVLGALAYYFVTSFSTV